MVEPMNELVDEVLKSIQTRLGNLEIEVTEVRAELVQLHRELDAARANRPEFSTPARGIERRIERLERRLTSMDTIDVALK